MKTAQQNTISKESKYDKSSEEIIPGPNQKRTRSYKTLPFSVTKKQKTELLTILKQLLRTSFLNLSTFSDEKLAFDILIDEQEMLKVVEMMIQRIRL